MRSILLSLPLLATTFLAPRTAAATVVDDFLLTGDGYTITFSEPSTGLTMDHPHGVYLGESVSATVNGVPGVTGNIQILANIINLPSVVLSLPGFPVTGLYGPLIDTYVVVPISNPTPTYPDNLLLTLVPGSYTLSGLDNQYNTVNFNLTITQESTPTPTPEPGTLALLSTGLAGAFAMRRRAVR